MKETEELAEVFKVLSDTTRLRLMKLLIENEDPLCVNALAHTLGVTQSAVSQHLRVLRQMGMVHGQRYGYHVHYSLDQGRLEECKRLFLETLGGESSFAE